MLEGLRRHWSVLTGSWSLESDRRRTATASIEPRFLPAALEIVERPPSPTARVTTWALLGFTAAAVTWACLAKIDVVAVAPGKLVPADKVKILQSSEGGVVRAIHVRDGDRVRAGQVLVELDPTMTGADAAQATSALLTASIEAARHRAILNGLDGRAPVFVSPADTPPEVARMEQRLVHAKLDEMRSRAAALREARAVAASDRAAAGQELAKYNEAMPIFDRQMAARHELMARGFSPKLQYLEMEQRRVEMARDREIARENGRRAASDMARLDQQRAETIGGARGAVLSDLSKAEAEVALRREELIKARQRSTLQRLVAPVDGTVQQLGVHTLGGVVEPAKPILTLVPAGGELVVEAAVLNRDAGFVRVGQPVTVKLEAFPFTRYGTLPGRVEWISSDAVSDEALGLVYQTRVRLERDTIGVGGRTLALGPGLAAAAEIETAKRRVIDYLLSPLSRNLGEAGRER